MIKKFNPSRNSCMFTIWHSIEYSTQETKAFNQPCGEFLGIEYSAQEILELATK
jgi:hypothetical protein